MLYVLSQQGQPIQIVPDVDIPMETSPEQSTSTGIRDMDSPLAFHLNLETTEEEDEEEEQEKSDRSDDVIYLFSSS